MCINKNEELLPYYEKAKKVLKYNQDTGELNWRENYSPKSRKDGLAGSVNGTGYIQIGLTINGKPRILYAHRIIWYIVHGELPNVIDHINMDKSNNSIKNLRSCTQQENEFNKARKKNGTSVHKGVSWHKTSGKWTSQITYNGKSTYLGLFNCQKKASQAYKAKSRELHGEFYNGN